MMERLPVMAARRSESCQTTHLGDLAGSKAWQVAPVLSIGSISAWNRTRERRWRVGRGLSAWRQDRL